MVLSPVYSSPIRATPLLLTNTLPDELVSADPSGAQPPAEWEATASPIRTAPLLLKNTSPEQAAVAVVTGLPQFFPLPVLLKTLSVPAPLAAGGIIFSPFSLDPESRPMTGRTSKTQSETARL